MALYNTKYHFHFPTYIPNTEIKDTFVSFFRLHLIACNPIEVGMQGIEHHQVEGGPNLNLDKVKKYFQDFCHPVLY